jgi:hypothetical protein
MSPTSSISAGTIWSVLGVESMWIAGTASDQGLISSTASKPAQTRRSAPLRKSHTYWLQAMSSVLA